MSTAPLTDTPVQGSPQRQRQARWGRPLVMLVLVIGLASVPTLQQNLGWGAYYVVFGYTLFFWITQASSWNLFSGMSGYLSFGHAIFYGAGMYVTANLAKDSESSLVLVLLLGALVAGGLALLIGWVVFRRGLAHEIFALFTFALAIAFGVLVRNVESIGGGGVIMVQGVTYPDFLGSINEMLYYAGLFLAVIAVGASWLVQRSRLGVGLTAIRDDERVAETIGVPTFRYKMIAFGLGSAIAGASGALNAVLVSFIEPEATFGIQLSVFVVLMSLVGGRRHWVGPVIGATLIFSLTDRLAGLGMTEVSQLLTGSLLIFVVVTLQGGVYERWRRHPIVGSAVFVAALAVLLVSGLAEGFIDALLFALLAMVAVLVLPDRWWSQVLTPRKERA